MAWHNHDSGSFDCRRLGYRSASALRAEISYRAAHPARVPTRESVNVAPHRRPYRVLGEDELREKAQWYPRAGVLIVWLILPGTREVIVLGKSGETRFCKEDRMSASPALPDLTPEVSAFFAQLDRA